jgi:hypothetical protein
MDNARIPPKLHHSDESPGAAKAHPDPARRRTVRVGEREHTAKAG